MARVTWTVAAALWIFGGTESERRYSVAFSYDPPTLSFVCIVCGAAQEFHESTRLMFIPGSESHSFNTTLY